MFTRNPSAAAAFLIAVPSTSVGPANKCRKLKHREALKPPKSLAAFSTLRTRPGISGAASSEEDPTLPLDTAATPVFSAMPRLHHRRGRTYGVQACFSALFHQNQKCFIFFLQLEGKKSANDQRLGQSEFLCAGDKQIWHLWARLTFPRHSPPGGTSAHTPTPVDQLKHN